MTDVNEYPRIDEAKLNRIRVPIELGAEEVNYIILGLRDLNEQYKTDPGFDDEGTRQACIRDNQILIDKFENALGSAVSKDD